MNNIKKNFWTQVIKDIRKRHNGNCATVRDFVHVNVKAIHCNFIFKSTPKEETKLNLSHSVTAGGNVVRNSFPGNRRTRMETSSGERRRGNEGSHKAEKKIDIEKKKKGQYSK